MARMVCLKVRVISVNRISAVEINYKFDEGLVKKPCISLRRVNMEVLMMFILVRLGERVILLMCYSISGMC